MLRVRTPWLCHANPWAAMLAARDDAVRLDAARLAACYAFRCDEKRFARDLLRDRANVWLYRCHQQRFCGDFVLVDMSSPVPAARRVIVVDLKLAAPLRRGGGGAGIQLRDAALAVAAVAECGVVPATIAFERVTGGREAVLAMLARAS